MTGNTVITDSGSRESCKKAFIAKVAWKAKDNGSNANQHAVNEFITIMDRVLALANGNTFGLSEVIRESKGVELDIEKEVKPLFAKWCEVMEDKNKICRLQSFVYDTDLWYQIS